MLKTLFAVVMVGLSANAAVASDLEPIQLEPITHHDAALVIVATDGTETRYSPSELEQLTTYRIRTTTPWRPEPADFDGVLLADVLALHGIDQVDAILVTAENDYRTTFKREVWENVNVMLATRVDDQPHNRRARGPIQFVIAASEFSQASYLSESHFVWMAARIEPQ